MNFNEACAPEKPPWQLTQFDPPVSIWGQTVAAKLTAATVVVDDDDVVDEDVDEEETDEVVEVDVPPMIEEVDVPPMIEEVDVPPMIEEVDVPPMIEVVVEMELVVVSITGLTGFLQAAASAAKAAARTRAAQRYWRARTAGTLPRQGQQLQRAHGANIWVDTRRHDSP